MDLKQFCAFEYALCTRLVRASLARLLGAPEIIGGPAPGIIGAGPLNNRGRPLSTWDRPLGLAGKAVWI